MSDKETTSILFEFILSQHKSNYVGYVSQSEFKSLHTIDSEE